MHIALSIWALLASWRWADWKKWEMYYPTMLYMSCMSLLYLFFANQAFYLWNIQPDSVLNKTTTELLHTFVVNPLAVFLFLSNYPTDKKITLKILHYAKWVFIFLLVEWIGFRYGRITYHNGWNFGWSAFFVLFMFPMLRLHFANKGWTIPLTFFWILFYLILFDY